MGEAVRDLIRSLIPTSMDAEISVLANLVAILAVVVACGTWLWRLAVGVLSKNAYSVISHR